MENDAPICMEAYRAGVAAAEEALAASPGPILFLEEGEADDTARGYAMGWNTIWACDENRRRAGAFDSCATHALVPCATPDLNASRIESDAVPNPTQADRHETADKSEAVFDVLIDAVLAWFD